MKVFICEKASVAKALKPFLPAGDVAAAAQGHLIELFLPEDYDSSLKKWNMDLLPFFPEVFQYKPKEATKHLLAGISQALKNNRVSEIVNACDYEREGELIFYLIYNYLKVSPAIKVSRLRVVDLTDAGIKKALDMVMPAESSKHFYYQALIRQQSDFILGINLTRAYTIKLSQGLMTPIGRIKSPILKIVSDRYQQHKDFKPQDYFKIRVGLRTKGIDFNALSKESFETSALADANLTGLSMDLLVEKAEFLQKTKSPGELYNLSGLQKAAYRKHKYSPSQTLDLAQKLYDEHKLITYPRTEGKALPEIMFDEVRSIVTNFKSYSPAQGFIGRLNVERSNRTLFNDKKVTDHHAIVPTLNLPSGQLEEDVLNVYHLVLEKFFQSMGESQIHTQTSYQLLCRNTSAVFNCSGKKITQAGYTDISFSPVSNLSEAENEDEQDLPVLEDKALVSVLSKEVLARKTTPAPLYNYATLLAVLENPKSIDLDESSIHFELSDLEDGFSLGTQATRAGIIEDMIKRPKSELLTLDKNSIIPTELGLFLHQNTKDKFFSNPYLTAGIEKQIRAISVGNASQNSGLILDKFKELVREDILNLNKLEISHKIQSSAAGINAHCPSCKSVIVETKTGYMCSATVNWFKVLPEEVKKDSEAIKLLEKPCRVSIPKIYFGKPISLSEAIKMLNLKDSSQKEFISEKTGRSYKASLYLNPQDHFKIHRRFADAQAKSSRPNQKSSKKS